MTTLADFIQTSSGRYTRIASRPVKLAPSECALIEDCLKPPGRLFKALAKENPDLTEAEVVAAGERVREIIRRPFFPETLTPLERTVLRNAIEESSVFGTWKLLPPLKRAALERTARGIERKLGISFSRD